MLRDGRLRDRETRCDVASAPLAARQQAQDLAPLGFSDGVEDFHAVRSLASHLYKLRLNNRWRTRPGGSDAQETDQAYASSQGALVSDRRTHGVRPSDRPGEHARR